MSTESFYNERPGLYCIELRTANWEESVNWYRNILGLRVLVRVTDDGYALLEAGDTRVALLSRKTPGEVSPRISLAFEVPDMAALLERLRHYGSEYKAPKQDAEALREISTTDPDGNSLRLFSWPRGK